MKTCLNRLIRRCKDCIPNYNPKNRPNNYDCKDYQEATLQVVKVKREDDEGID